MRGSRHIASGLAFGLADKGVTDCVVRGFSNLSFPEPEDRKKVLVTYPVIFGLGSSGRAGGVNLNVPLVVTRLHARYGKSALGADLVFRAADPIVGGRETWTDGSSITAPSRSSARA